VPQPFDVVQVDWGCPVIDVAGLVGFYTLSVGTPPLLSGRVDLLQGDFQAAQEWIGYEGSGEFRHLGGSHFVWDVGGLSLGDARLVIDGGTLDTHGSAIAVPQFHVGADPGASGAYTHSAGTLTAQGMTVGLCGTGTFIHTGGTVTVEGASLLSIGGAAGGHGTYELSGVGSVLNAKPMVGSSGGTGTFNQHGAGTFTQTGGTHVVGTALVLGEKGKAGTYSLEGGSLSAAQVDVKAGGTFRQTGGTLGAVVFNQSGGTVEGRLENRGTFTYSAGTFAGRLINLGTADCAADFTAGDGIENYGSLAGTVTNSGVLRAEGGQLTLAGAGAAFDLLDWGGLTGEFAAVHLPALAGGLAWDASDLYGTGTLGVVPEPASAAVLAAGLAALVLRRRSPRPATARA